MNLSRLCHVLRNLSILALIAAIAAMTGCGVGGGQKNGRPTSPGYYATATATSDGAAPQSTAGYGASDDSSAPAPAAMESADYGGADAARSYRPTPEPQPEERPGLGTVFGETVSSHVRMKPFVRAASHPFATVAVHYNDEQGVRAHLGYIGASGLSPVRAHTPHGGISIALTDEYGNLLPGGEAGGRVFVVGHEGQRYNMVLHNQTGGRYEVVSSVDGLDVIDGRPADLAKRGYILEPYSTLTIDGFRRSTDHVAAFRFGRVSESYAARTSGDRNVGVVGVAIFAEQGSAWTTDELYRRDTANPFPGDRNYAQPPGY